MATTNLLIANNVVAGSRGAGITLVNGLGMRNDIGGTVAGNAVTESSGPGIEVGGTLRSFAPLALRGNFVFRNGGDGIKVGSPAPGRPDSTGGPVTLTDNYTVANRGKGINATWAAPPSAIVDGGGNTARSNASSPPCVGVACS